MPQYISTDKGFILPKDTGASDLEDSARLAGMLAAAESLQPLPTPGCYLNPQGELARWYGSTLPFTRDQLLCLAYFHYKLGGGVLAPKLAEAAGKLTAPNGKDPLNPAHRAHLKACVSGKYEGSLLAKAFLVTEIIWHTMHERGLSEPNQLICMLLTAGPRYVRLWQRLNNRWAESINMYWCGWRNETLLAAMLINKLRSM